MDVALFGKDCTPRYGGFFWAKKMATKLPRFFSQATSLVFKTYEQSVVQRFMALKSNLQFEPRLKNVLKDHRNG